MIYLRKRIFLLGLMVLLSSTETLAQERNSNDTLVGQIKSALRPVAVSLLGEETASEYFGHVLDQLELPTPPELEENAKDATAKKALNENTLSEKQWERYNINYVKELFQVVRKSQANRNDLAKWMNVLSQGATQEGVYRAMVLDQTYAGLENYPKAVNEAVVDFTIWYMKKFNNREYSRDKVEGVNFFSIKRIMSEKSLETLDGLALQAADDFYRWYAVFSGELARRYPNAFRDELRSNPMMSRHEAWAKGSPEQLIKAEMLIKLHLVFNYLQG